MTLRRAHALSLAAGLMAAALACTPTHHAEWLTDSELAATREVATDFPEAPAVTLLRSRKFFFYFGPGESWTRVWHHEAWKVRTEAGKALAEVRIPVPGGANFVEVRARTISPEGKVVELTQDQLVEVRAEAARLDDEFSVRIFRFPDVQVGSVLEYFCDVRFPRLLTAIDEPIAQQVPVRRYELEMRVPNRIRFDLAGYNLADVLTRDQGVDFTRVTLTLDHIDSEHSEWKGPDWTAIRPWWSFRVRQLNYGSWHSKPRDTWAQNLANWTEYLDTDPELLAGFDAKLPPDGCAEADRRCRIEAAVRWLRQKTRPTEFGSWGDVRPMKAVLDGVTASGWELAILLRRLLLDAGIQAELAPTTRVLSRLVDPGFTDLHQLNHALAYVPQQEGLAEPLWIDPTCVHCALGQIPDWVYGVDAIPLPKDADAEARFLRVSGQPTHRRETRTVFTVALDPDGNADVTLEATGVGDAFVFEAARRGAMRAEELEKWARELVHDLAPAAQFVSFEAGRCDEATARCVTTMRFKVASLATVDGTRLLIPLNLFSKVDGESLREDRRTDVHLAYDFFEEELIHLKLPEGFRVENLPASAHTELPGFGVSFTIARTDDGFTARRQFEWKRAVHAAVEWPEIREVFEAYRAVPAILVSATREGVRIDQQAAGTVHEGAP